MNPYLNETIINMKNAEDSLTKEELQILNILIGKVQDFEDKLFNKTLNELNEDFQGRKTIKVNRG
jgi:hypothetical protein